MNHPNRPSLAARIASNQQQLDTALQTWPDARHIELLVADASGILRGKLLPVTDAPKLACGEVVLPRGTLWLDTLGRALDNLPYGVPDGDPDRSLWLVPGGVQPVLWRDKPALQALCVIGDDAHNDWHCNPRTVLERVLRGFARHRLQPVVATELEFYLMVPQPDAAGGVQPASGLPGHSSAQWPAFSGPQTYNLDVLSDYSPLLDAIQSACADQHIPITNIVSEYGNGQFEINLKHSADVVAACDHALLLRRIVRQVAQQHGLLATFMAKPLANESGNGMHIHTSLLNADGGNAFNTSGTARLEACFKGADSAAADAATANSATRLPPDVVQQHPLLARALAGSLATMQASVALFAGNENAYRRFAPDNFAPVCADWGIDHRAVALRIPQAPTSDDGTASAAIRIEHRLPGADANPYLAVAAVLAGILHGLEQSSGDAPTLIPPTIADRPHPAAAALPTRWREALHAFSDSATLKHYLGKEFCELYAMLKYTEEEQCHLQVTDADRQQYLRMM